MTASSATAPPRRPAAALRPVTVTAPPLFGSAIRSHMAERDPPVVPPSVDRGPIWWPLTLVVVLLAAAAVMVAPAGVVALTP